MSIVTKTAVTATILAVFMMLPIAGTAAPARAGIVKECYEWHHYLLYHWIDSVREEADMTQSDPPYYTGEADCPDSLTELTKKDLRIVRNAVYARHGRPFKTKDLQDFFYAKNKSRFKINRSYKDSMLTKIDKKNIAYIQKLEKEAR